MSQSAVDILLVEDDPGHVELIRRGFESREGRTRLRVAASIAEARREIGAGRPALVLADWKLPDGDGLDLLQPEGGPPLVLMTSHGNEQMVVDALRAGAVDYVVKTDAALADMPHLVDRALRQRRLEEALRDAGAGITATGQAFFESLVVRLSRTLGTRYAFVAEITGPDQARARMVALCDEGELRPNFEYALVHTPCERVAGASLFFAPRGVMARFPEDALARQMDAEGYVGVRLASTAGEPLGILAAVHDGPIDPAARPEEILLLFAGRAAAEMERLRAVREIDGQRTFAESLLDVVSSLVLVLDTEGRVVRFNRACEACVGWTEEEVRGRPFWELLTPGDRPLMRAVFAHIDSARFPISDERPLMTRDGGFRLIAWTHSAIRDAASRVSYVISTGADVTEARRTQEALRAGEERYRTLVEHAPEAILVLDADRRAIVDANANAARLSGVEVPQLLATDPARLVPERQPDGRRSAEVAADLARRALSGESAVAEAVVRGAGGHMIPCEVRVVRLPEAGAARLRVSLADISERRRLEESLRQSRTMAAVGSLVVGVAHEVRNPLFSLSATLDAFEARFRERDGYSRYVSVLREQISRLTTLMGELLEYGRPAVLDLGDCALEEVVSEAAAACAPLAARKGVRVSVPAGATLVRADRKRLLQVFQNLVENAIHFSPRNAGVRLDVRPDATRGTVECAVVDRGPGFAEEDRERLFEPFFTRRRGGTGLGLSIVRRIVDEHGGDITAANDPSGGASFTVRLPFAGAPRGEPSA